MRSSESVNMETENKEGIEDFVGEFDYEITILKTGGRYLHDEGRHLRTCFY